MNTIGRISPKIARRTLALALCLAVAGAAAAAADGWIGRYGSKALGDAWDLQIEPNGPGSYKISAAVDTGRPLCSASLDNVTGKLQAGKLVTLPPKGETCSLTIARTADGLVVQENEGCSIFHGAACAFDGKYPRLGAAKPVASVTAPAFAPRPAAAPAATSLVGGWVPEGGYCASDAPIVLKADGTYFQGSGINGSWRVTGGSIALTYVAGEGARARKEIHALRQSSADELMLDKVRYHRCPTSGDGEPWHPVGQALAKPVTTKPVAARAPAPPSGLSAADTAAVFTAAGARHSGRNWLLCSEAGASIVQVSDFNGDGRPEALVADADNSECYGNGGPEFDLLTKVPSGIWVKIASGQGVPIFLKTKGPAGWPDIEIGGPGFCFAELGMTAGGLYRANGRNSYSGKACKPSF